MTSTAAKGAEVVALPPAYRILPHSIPFRVPGFIKQSRPEDRVLAPHACNCEEWFSAFADRVSNAVGRTFLPVCRMSDGEFFFLFGQQPPSLRLPFRKRVTRGLRQNLSRVRRLFTGFHAATASGVSSGDFTPTEWPQFRAALSQDYLSLLDKGVLAIHLSYGKNPFQEQYFSAIHRWLSDSGQGLTASNYVPFYFVYALLRGPRMSDLVPGRRVLLVHSAVGAKREAIARSLSAFSPRSIEWVRISPNRSFTDTLDLKSIADQPDLCFVGAGIGKSRILVQLEPLQVPCIDAGYAFEAWADPDRQWDRPYMTCDKDMDVTKVRFLSPERRVSLEVQ